MASLYSTMVVVCSKREEFCLEQASMMQSLPRTAAAVAVYALVALIAAGAVAAGGGEQPLARIAIHRAIV